MLSMVVLVASGGGGGGGGGGGAFVVPVVAAVVAVVAGPAAGGAEVVVGDAEAGVGEGAGRGVDGALGVARSVVAAARGEAAVVAGRSGDGAEVSAGGAPALTSGDGPASSLGPPRSASTTSLLERGATRRWVTSDDTSRTPRQARPVAADVTSAQTTTRMMRPRTYRGLPTPAPRRTNGGLNGGEGPPVPAYDLYRVAVASVSLIEDDPRIKAALVRVLAGRGHVVLAASTAMEGLTQVVEFRPDVVVLDLGLPDMDGSELLKMIRAITPVPVIVATARDDEVEIVRLLNQGADDYVVKPFSGEQLDARIGAVLRRSVAAEEPGELVVGDLRINLKSREAALAGRRLDLTRKEFDLLSFLATRTGTVVTKNELLAEVWRQPLGGGDKTIDVHLSWLRRKLGETAAEPRYLQTVRGVGVKLVAPEP